MKNFFKPNSAVVTGIAVGSFVTPAIMPSSSLPYLASVGTTFVTSLGIMFLIYGLVYFFSKD